jgi:hypothetical protein
LLEVEVELLVVLAYVNIKELVAQGEVQLEFQVRVVPTIVVIVLLVQEAHKMRAVQANLHQ